MSGDLKVGLIGAGKWGKNIVRTLDSIPRVQLTHIATRTQQFVENISSSCIVTTDWRSVVTNDDIDGVIIASPAGLHAEMSAYALKQKKPIFIEKPMALTVVDGQMLYDLVEKYSGILQVGYIDIANPAWQELKEQLSLVGDITNIEAIFGGMGPIRPDITPLWDWGTHPIALILSLLKEPDYIRAQQIYQRQTDDGCIEDINIFLDYTSIQTRISVSNNYQESFRRLYINGTKGKLIYDDNNVDKLLFLKEEKIQVLEYPKISPLRSELERFIKSIMKGAPDYEDAYLGLLVTKTLSNIDSLLHDGI